MMRRPDILFLTSNLSSFVKGDLQILKRHYPVREIVTGGKPAGSLVQRLSLGFSILFGILKADITFSWFAHNHSYLAVRISKLLGKKSVVVVGGYEVANEPDIEYGAIRDPELAKRVRYILENADCILAVSEFSKKEILSVAGPRRIKMVYNGIDTDVFSPMGQKEEIVLTVCVISAANVRVKGLDTFIEVARHLPEMRFVFLGKFFNDVFETLNLDIPSNLEIITSPSQDELLQWYRRAKIYCQLSYRESFGVALAEAMSCECIPVVTDRGALPEVVGDVGFVVPYGDAQATVDAISKALTSDIGSATRERVREAFSVERRAVELHRIIASLQS